MIRNLRPNLDDNNDLKIEPSFDGILPSTISYSKDNKVNKVAFSPSVCDSSKLLLGKCPSRFNEVVINKNLEIVFTKEGETADSYIERKVHEIGKRYEVCVVTSDGLEQQTIFQRGHRLNDTTHSIHQRKD